MEITGTQLIAAPRAEVWNALNDPAVLRKCLPGCESVERSAADEFKVIVVSAIGPLRARFNGMLRLTEVQAPRSCVMMFEGQGGAVGFGKGSSAVTLQEKDGRTELSYSAHAQVGGKLAQVGSRLIDSVARKMSDDFFKAFHRQFEAAAIAGRGALRIQHALAFLLLVDELGLGADRDACAFDLHLDVLFRHAGQVDLDLVLVTLLDDVEAGAGHGLVAAVHRRGRTGEEVVEEVVK